MKSKKKIAGLLFISTLILFCFPGCEESSSQQTGLQNISFSDITYRDIPGVTDEEIIAIEALKEQFDYFIYGMLHSTESFYNMDGEIDGFTRLVCEWLTELFGISFVPKNYIWTDMLDGLEDNTIDFSGYLMPTAGRRQTYHMTDPIAQRIVKYYRLRDSMPIPEIRKVRLPRYALVENAATSHNVLQYSLYDFEPVYVEVYTDAYELMINGEVDALVTVGVLEIGFGSDVMTEDFMPPIFASTSFATQSPALVPFVSVVQKALDNGAILYFNELYHQGYREYLRYMLLSWLNEEEAAFLKNNPVIPIAAERDNYPAAFYSTHYEEWQGIAFDVLREVKAFTGLQFEVVNETPAEWHELLKMLEDGDAKMVTHLARTSEREGRFIWPESSFYIDQSVLISKNELRNISISEVFLMRVGLVRDSVHEELFRTWFPDHNLVFSYDSMGESFAALVRGEIDMVMNTQSGLLYLTNFMELAGYKANVLFNNSLFFTFGLNNDEAVLLSILDKSMQLIDTEMISSQWLRRTYDYRIRIAETQRRWITLVTVTLALMLVVLTIIIIYIKKSEKIKSIISQKAMREARDAAEMASHAKSEFLATMSHEIRTPMNSIMGFAELAADLAVVPEVQGYLNKITDSTKWLLRIINDILDISKIEAGKMELDHVPFDLNVVFSRCQSVILPNIKEKGLSLNIYVEKMEGKSLLGDPVRLYQVLMNLLSNAVKFTQTGTIKFSCLPCCPVDSSVGERKEIDFTRRESAACVSSIKSADNSTNDTITVYFEVKDTGIGMTNEQIDRIFGMFVQADSSTTREFGGTGLGLAIAKNIVELMGGKLIVESSPGIGSTFSFEITFETIEALEDSQDRTKPEILERPYFNGLVLVCDDNSMNQQVICAHLARIGLKAISAENGKVGVKMVQDRKDKNEKPFDLIFMDMFMPFMDGMEAASRIFEMKTGAPIVAMTANVMVSELEKYKKNGMPDCLGKPFTAQELWQILLKYLKPVRREALDRSIDEHEENKALQKKLQINFAKNNQTVYTEIREAVTAGDIKLAHRLAHSLKGNSGLIGKNALRNAAAEVEDRLKNWAVSTWESKMSLLKTELEHVLEELQPLLDEEATIQENSRNNLIPAPDSTLVLALFDKLKPMLESNNTDCIDMLGDILAIPGTKELAQQIDDFDFKSASSTLMELYKKWEETND